MTLHQLMAFSISDDHPRQERVYDGEQTSMKTTRFVAAQIKRLHEAGIQVFVIRGNHDALSHITKELTFPASVKVYGCRSDVMVSESPGVTVLFELRTFLLKIQRSASAVEMRICRWKCELGWGPAVNVGISARHVAARLAIVDGRGVHQDKRRQAKESAQYSRYLPHT